MNNNRLGTPYGAYLQTRQATQGKETKAAVREQVQSAQTKTCKLLLHMAEAPKILLHYITKATKQLKHWLH